MSVKLTWYKSSKWHQWAQMGWTTIKITKMVDAKDTFYVDIKTLYTDGVFDKVETSSWARAKKAAIKLALESAEYALIKLHKDADEKAEAITNSIKLIKEMR